MSYEQILLRHKRHQEVLTLIKEKELYIKANRSQLSVTKFKSNTAVELENARKRGANGQLLQKPFIKHKRLVIFIDCSPENLLNFRKLVKMTDFTGKALYF